MVNKDEVKYIAQIAKLHIAEDELESFTKKFDDVMEFMEKIKEVNTDGIEPTYSVIEDEGFVKDDDNPQLLDREEILKNTKESKHGYFKLLRVVE